MQYVHSKCSIAACHYDQNGSPSTNEKFRLKMRKVHNASFCKIAASEFEKNRLIRHSIFSKNERFLSPYKYTYVCVSGSKKWSFFEKVSLFCFLVTFVLIFVLLPYYRRISCSITQKHIALFILPLSKSHQFKKLNWMQKYLFTRTSCSEYLTNLKMTQLLHAKNILLSKVPIWKLQWTYSSIYILICEISVLARRKTVRVLHISRAV